MVIPPPAVLPPGCLACLPDTDKLLPSDGDQIQDLACSLGPKGLQLDRSLWLKSLNLDRSLWLKDLNLDRSLGLKMDLP